MKTSYDMVVIGAGPAGMAAASLAASLNIEVAVLDEQAHPGGQIYHRVDRSPLVSVQALGRDYADGLLQVTSFRQAKIDYLPNTAVWYLDEKGLIGVLRDGVSFQIQAHKVVIASGAQERPMPFPGWQLPGVMTAGAGQILLKSAALVPGQPVVLAGSGPLLLLLAVQYLNCGVKIQAILDTTPKGNSLRALRHFPRALLAIEYLLKGISLVGTIRRAGIPHYRRVENLCANGEGQLNQIGFCCDGKPYRLDTSLMMLYLGIIPDLHMAQAANTEIRWNEAQQCWVASVDEWGQSSQEPIFSVGDGASIMGARVATASGKLAALQIAFELGEIDLEQRDRLAIPLRKLRQRHLGIRPLLESLYRIPEMYLNPVDETIVCRCEEITASEIRALAQLGCVGPNQAKAFTRCGMGRCQGRLCATTVTQIMAKMRDRTPLETGLYRARPPLKPITLGELAAAHDANQEY